MKKLNARPLVALIAGRNFKAATEPICGCEFIKTGATTLVALHRVAQITQRREGAHVARAVKELFDRQLHKVIAYALDGRKAAKQTIALEFDDHASLWAQAMEEVFAEEGVAIEVALTRPIQKVMAQGYSRTNLLIGQEDLTLASTIATEARGLAKLVTRVNATTRNRISEIVRDGISDGLSVVETADLLRSAVPTINSNRAVTIARTEMNNAWTQGSVKSFQESETITHVSVIGCQSREEERWDDPSYAPYLYNGESTCNIEDVPVTDADSLQFHINHTGTMVPSQFRD